MNGSIYCLRSHKTPNIYIGSTTQPLSHRIRDHRKLYKKYINNNFHYLTSFEIMKYDDVYIELIENVIYNTKQELEKKEGEYIRKMSCVNKYIAGRSKQDYYEEHKEEIKEKRQNYYNDNKEEISNKKKETLICICGITHRKVDKSRHLKTQTHINFINPV